MAKAQGKAPKDRPEGGRKHPVGFWGREPTPPPVVQIRNAPSPWSRSLDFLRRLVGLGRKKG